MFGKESKLLFIIYKTVNAEWVTIIAEWVTIIAGLFKVNRSQIHEPQTFLLMGSLFWSNLACLRRLPYLKELWSLIKIILLRNY